MGGADLGVHRQGEGAAIEFHTAMLATLNAFGGPLLDDVKVVEIN